MTPVAIAKDIIAKTEFGIEDTILEPSFGDGSFVYGVIDKLKKHYGADEVSNWCRTNLYGCENDNIVYESFKSKWEYGEVPVNFVNGDFFRFDMPSFDKHSYFSMICPKYDLIIGNPPFGGTIDIEIQDELDAIFGFRNGLKIKKETYAFFIVKCIDLLKDDGELVFICSDTLMSINTMSGLRQYMMSMGRIVIERLPGEFDETKQPMIVLRFYKNGKGIVVFGNNIPIENIDKTPNKSWTITNEYLKYFTGKCIGDYMIASSGMTVGCNELFIRDIQDGKIIEPYEFKFGKRNITLEMELKKARLGKIPVKRQLQIQQMEKDRIKEDIVIATKRDKPVVLDYPNEDYAPYNKATNKIVYAPPTSAIFWKDDGKYVYTFKKSGNWYLHGVGGKPFFKKEGITWQLISSKIHMRYLPEGYILDSGAPCAFLRTGVERDEMFFILGWCLTETSTKILKNVINHTRNIQSKDIERLPYPSWVGNENKSKIISTVKEAIKFAQNGKEYQHDSNFVSELENLFEFNQERELNFHHKPEQLLLF